MAKTKKARLVVLLEPETFNVVKAMSDAGGVSMSAFVASMVEEARPQMKQIADALNAAKTNRLEALEAMSEALAGILHKGTEASVELHQTRRELRAKVQEQPAAKRKPRK